MLDQQAVSPLLVLIRSCTGTMAYSKRKSTKRVKILTAKACSGDIPCSGSGSWRRVVQRCAGTVAVLRPQNPVVEKGDND